MICKPLGNPSTEIDGLLGAVSQGSARQPTVAGSLVYLAVPAYFAGLSFAFCAIVAADGDLLTADLDLDTAFLDFPVAHRAFLRLS